MQRLYPENCWKQTVVTYWIAGLSYMSGRAEALQLKREKLLLLLLRQALFWKILVIPLQNNKITNLTFKMAIIQSSKNEPEKRHFGHVRCKAGGGGSRD